MMSRLIIIGRRNILSHEKTTYPSFSILPWMEWNKKNSIADHKDNIGKMTESGDTFTNGLLALNPITKLLGRETPDQFSND